MQSTSHALPPCNCVIVVTVETVETVVTPVIVTAAASSETRSLPVPGSCEIGRVIASRIAYKRRREIREAHLLRAVRAHAGVIGRSLRAVRELHALVMTPAHLVGGDRGASTRRDIYVVGHRISPPSRRVCPTANWP